MVKGAERVEGRGVILILRVKSGKSNVPSGRKGEKAVRGGVSWKEEE